MTQDQVAASMGIPQPRYQRHESGTTEASLSFILGAAEALGVSPADLLGVSSASPSLADAVRVVEAAGLAVVSRSAIQAAQPPLSPLGEGSKSKS